MPNQYVNKVVQSNGTTLIDISDTTALAADVASGKYFYLASGEKVEGTASGEAILTTKSITANGIYNASNDNADGYSSVTVNVQHVGPQLTLIGQSTHTLTEYADTSAAETIDTGIDVTGDNHSFLLVIITCDDGTPAVSNAWGGIYMDVTARYTATGRIYPSTAGVCEAGTKSLLMSEASGFSIGNSNGPVHLVSNVPTVRFIRKASNNKPVMAGTYTVKVYGIDSL